MVMNNGDGVVDNDFFQIKNLNKQIVTYEYLLLLVEVPGKSQVCTQQCSKQSYAMYYRIS